VESLEKEGRMRLLQRSLGHTHSRDSAIDTDLQVPDTTIFWIRNEKFSDRDKHLVYFYDLILHLEQYRYQSDAKPD
jgi:hypothetical protein